MIFFAVGVVGFHGVITVMYGGMVFRTATTTARKALEHIGLFSHRSQKPFYGIQTIARDAREQRTQRHASVAVPIGRC